jgi:hypothetical protein
VTLTSSGKAEAGEQSRIAAITSSLMADWLDEPLWMLGNNPSLVTARHEKITNENGP